MKNWLAELMDRVFVVAGALVFSQAPVFFQQYTQRLGGHVSELRRQVSLLQSNAALSGKSLAEYVQKFVGSQDPDFSLQGNAMEQMLSRYTELRQAYEALLQAPPLSKPLVFLKDLQPDVAQLTLSDFSFGLQFTPEALAYALAGIVFGYFTFRSLKGIFSFSVRMIVKKDDSNLNGYLKG